MRVKTAGIACGVAACLFTLVAAAQSPNERIHALQKRDYSVKNKIEISSFFGMSLDDVFTQHYSGVLGVSYHFDEAIALEGLWLSCKLPFYSGQKSSYRLGHSYSDAYDNLNTSNLQLAPTEANLAMISNYLGLNVEFSPIYGKFSFFNWGLVRADFYITAGGGVVSTEFQRPDKSWVDTGNYFMGNIGVGFRIFLQRWFSLRVDIRDYTFAAKVDIDNKVDTKIRSTLFLFLGVSFLFGGEAPVEIWSPY